MNEFEKKQGCVKAIFEYRYVTNSVIHMIDREPVLKYDEKPTVREYIELNETGLGAVGNFTLLKAVKEDRFSRKQ